ncbi:MAG: hypothetical protein L0Z53_10830 [Acidobacteriales bacterium]|nr:hypothetical protein [Terriglobales bacterium]
MQNLLRGVVSIERQPEAYLLCRSDGQTLLLARGTIYGDRLFNCMDKAEKDAGKKIGSIAAEFVHKLNALVVVGNEIQLRHAGAESVVVAFPNEQPFIPVRLKELRLGTIRMRLDENTSPPKLYGVDGVEAIVTPVGVPISIRPREFSRWKDASHNTHLDFGIASLIPAPLRMLTGLPDVMHFSITIKRKKDSQSNASAVS